MSKSCYMFFNCDEQKSAASMNVKYNNVVYRCRDGRRALWKKIKEEVAAGRIFIDEQLLSIVRIHILEGNPEDINDLILYGNIVKLDEIDG